MCSVWELVCGYLDMVSLDDLFSRCLVYDATSANIVTSNSLCNKALSCLFVDVIVVSFDLHFEESEQIYDLPKGTTSCICGSDLDQDVYYHSKYF